MANIDLVKMAEVLAQDPAARGVLYTAHFERAAITANDFAKFYGAPNSKKPFWTRKELAAKSGAFIKMAAIGALAGPGVLGEEKLIGNESKTRFGGNSVEVDFFRDAVALNKSQEHQLPAGESLEDLLYTMLGEKVGLRQQNDMAMKLLRAATKENTILAGGRSDASQMLKTDRLSSTLLGDAKARANTNGAIPVSVGKSESGSLVPEYLAFCTSEAIQSFKNSSAYHMAVSNAALRSKDNPIFSGRLLPWNGLQLWEHIVVNQDADDYKGSPFNPYGVLGEAVGAGNTAVFDIKGSSTNTRSQYFQFFPGFDYKWTSTQMEQGLAADAKEYYAWIINTAGTNAGKAMFVKYLGSGNNGNRITITQRLGATAAGAQSTTLGEIAWDATAHTMEATAGAMVIPCNAKGTCCYNYSLLLGAGAGLYAQGQITLGATKENEDYGFVQGRGVELIRGYGVSLDTLRIPRNYVLIQHAVDLSGIVIPGVYGV